MKEVFEDTDLMPENHEKLKGTIVFHLAFEIGSCRGLEMRFIK